MIPVYNLGNIQNKALKHKKVWEKDYGGSFGLGRKSLGTNTDTETWSWFWLPIPKPGFGHTLLFTDQIYW